MTPDQKPETTGVDLDEIDRMLALASKEPSSTYAPNSHEVLLLAPDLSAELRTLRARVAELEKLFDDAGQGNYNVLALIDHYQSEAMVESERRREAEARVRELEIELLRFEVNARKASTRITSLESEAARLREQISHAQGELSDLLDESIGAPTPEALSRVMVGRVRAAMRKLAQPLSPGLMRAILETEAKS